MRKTSLKLLGLFLLILSTFIIQGCASRGVYVDKNFGQNYKTEIDGSLYGESEETAIPPEIEENQTETEIIEKEPQTVAPAAVANKFVSPDPEEFRAWQKQRDLQKEQPQKKSNVPEIKERRKKMPPKQQGTEKKLARNDQYATRSELRALRRDLADLSIRFDHDHSDTKVTPIVMFNPGSTKLNKKGEKSLQDFAKMYKSGQIYNIKVWAFTDKVKPRVGTNEAISLGRALAVKLYLESLGVEVSDVKGMGEAYPGNENESRCFRLTCKTKK